MGKLTEAVDRLIKSLQITSAGGDSPKINEVLQSDPSIDLDAALEDRTDKQVKESNESKKTVAKVKNFEQGNVGKIQKLSSEQFGNITQLAANPLTFVMGAVFRKIPKFISRAGPLAIFLILIEEMVKFAINELLKPGRALDRRFKQEIEKETLQFLSRKDQQKLKQGFASIIITASQGLRGGYKQFYSTLDGVRTSSLVGSGGALGGNTMLQLSSGVSHSKHKGNHKATNF